MAAPRRALPCLRRRASRIPRRHSIATAVALAFAAISVVAPPAATAADRTLVNAGFSWDNPAAWSPIGEPRHGENVFIEGGTIRYAPSTLFSGDTFASVIVDGTDNFGAGNMRWVVNWNEGVIVTPSLPFAHALEVQGRTLRTSFLALAVQQPTIGGFRSGALFQDGGRVEVGGNAVLGERHYSAGYYRMSGSGAVLAVGGDMVVGNDGQGLLAIDRGTASVAGTFYLGRDFGGSGILNLLGGSLSVGGDSVIGGGGPPSFFPFQSRTVPVGGMGIVRQRDALHEITGNLVLGSNFGGLANYETFAGAVLRVGGSIVMGRDEGWADLLLGGGAATTGLDVVVGQHSTGPFNPVVPNRLTLRGGAQLTVGRDLIVGDGGLGVVELTGDASVGIAGSLFIGRSSTGGGTLSIVQGSLTAGGPLVLGSAAGSQGRLELAGTAASTTLTVGGVLVVGDAGQGTFLHQRSGQTSLPGGLIAGYSAGGTGAIEVTGSGGLSIGSGLVIGAAGSGSLTQNGTGALTVTGLTVLGQHAGSQGTLNFLGASAASFAGGLIVGDRGTGTFNQAQPGILIVDGSVVLGRESGGTGHWNMSPGTSKLVLGSLVIGDAGQGTADARDTAASLDIVLGARATGVGTVNVRSGEWVARQDLVLGDLGRGTLNIEAGHVRANRDLVIGRGAGATGTVTVPGTARITVDRDLVIGDAGTGTLVLTRPASGDMASVGVGGQLILGRQPGATGTLQFLDTSPTGSTAGLTVGSTMEIGRSGDGRVHLSGGTHEVNGGLLLAVNPGSRAELLLTGSGSLNVRGHLRFVGAGDARVVQDGLDVSVLAFPSGASSDLNMFDAGGTNRYELRAGRLSVSTGTVSVATNSSLLVTGGTLTAPALSLQGGTVTFDRELALGGPPGTGHHVQLRLDNGAGSVLTMNALAIRAGGEYNGSPTGQLQTTAIDMSGGAVYGVLQNTGVFRYSGGSFLAGAGLRNEGSVDLQSDLVLGFLDNVGDFRIPAGRAVTVGGPGGGTGVIQNSGWLMNEGTLQAAGLVVTAGGNVQQSAGSASFAAGGVRVGSTGPAFANVIVTGGTVTSRGPIEVGLAGPAGVNIGFAELALQGADASLRIGAQGVASIRNAAFWRIDGDALDVHVDAGGVLVMDGASLGVGRIRVDGSLHVLGGITREGRGFADTTVQVGPGGLLLFNVPPPAGFNDGVPFTPNIVNEGAWRKVGISSEHSLLSGRVTQNGTLDVEESALVLTGGGTGSGATRIWTTGRMDLRGKPSVPQTTYEWGGTFVNDGRMLVAGDGTGTTRATFASTGMHGGSFLLSSGGTMVVSGGTQTFVGGAAGILAQGGSLEIAGGTAIFQAGSRLAATSGLVSSSTVRFLGGSVRMEAGSTIVLPERFAIEGTDLALSTGGAHGYGRDILLSAGALGGSDAFTHSAGRFDWTGGTLYGTGALTLDAPTTLAIGGAADKRLDRALRAHGVAQWSGGNVNGSGVFELASGSAFFGTAAGGFAPRVETRGSFLSQVDSGTATYLGRFDALGATVTIDRGGMKLAGGGSSDAPFEVRAGANIEFAGSGREFVFDGAGARLFGGGMARFVDGRTVFRNGATFGALGAETIAGGTLDLGAGSRYTFNPALTIESGAVLVSTGLGSFTLPATTTLQSGVLGGSDDRTLSAGGTLTWLGGTIGGPGSTGIAPGALLDMPGGGVRTLESALLIGGRAVWSGGSIGGSTTMHNLAGATFDVSGGSSLGPSLTNAGLLRVTNGAATTTFQGSFRNDGSMRIESGGLQVNGAFQNLSAGTLAGGTYFLAGAFRHSGGIVTTVSADVTLSGAAASFRSITGTELLDGFATVSAGARLEIADGRNFSFGNDRTITVDGRFEVGAGSLLTAARGNLTGAGVIEIKPGAQMLWTTAFLNGANGTLRVAPGATLTLQDVTSNHDHFGRAFLNEGTVRWTGGDVRGGLAGGAASRIVNAGLWQDEGTTARNVSAFSTPVPLVFENTGTYSKTSSGTTRFSGQGLANSGRFEVNAGIVELFSGGSNSGTIDIAAGSAMTLRGGTFEFAPGGRTTGSGAWRIEDGTLAVNGAASFSNLVLATGVVSGTHAIDGRVVWQRASFNTPGTTTIASGGLLILQDATSNHDHFGRTIVNQGTVRWTSGDVRGGMAGGVASRIVNAGLWQDEIAAAQNASAFNVSSPLVFANTGTYVKSLANGVTTPTTTNFRGYRMDNGGTVEVAAGTLNLERGVEQVVGSRLTGGTWIVGTDALILIPDISPLTINEGRVHLRGPNSRMSGISTLADNRGEFRISEGRNFTTVGNLVNSGLIFAGAGSRLTVNGTFTSTGTLGGSGELQVGLLSAAGPIAPGSSPGRMRVDGSLAMQGTASLDIEIAGPQAGVGYDTLEVTGSATIAGRLRVDVLAGFPTMAATSFAILTAASVAGEFTGLADGARFDASGLGGSFVIDYTPTAVYLTDYIAPVPVPEPEAWALMGIGALLVGARAARGRREGARPVADPRGIA